MNERGEYSLLLNSTFLENKSANIYIGKLKGLIHGATSSEIKDCLGLMNNLSHSLDLKLIVELSKKLSHVNNYDVLATLLDLAYYNKYIDYCNLFYGPLHNKIFNTDLIYCSDEIKTHIFNNIIFFVDNKELLINNIREKGYIVSEGPQKWRGHINSINNLLNSLDSDYRNSLYNHYCYHYFNKSLPDYTTDYILDKEHFYFRNIHHNLGNIKW